MKVTKSREKKKKKNSVTIIIRTKNEKETDTVRKEIKKALRRVKHLSGDFIKFEIISI